MSNNTHDSISNTPVQRQTPHQRRAHSGVAKIATGPTDQATSNAIMSDYNEYWTLFQQHPYLSLASIENYYLGWCEDPTDLVTSTLLAVSPPNPTDTKRARPGGRTSSGHNIGTAVGSSVPAVPANRSDVRSVHHR